MLTKAVSKSSLRSRTWTGLFCVLGAGAGALPVGALVADGGFAAQAGSVGEPYFLMEEAHPVEVTAPHSAVPLSLPTFYNHGTPTDLEQLMLELINRARADPGAEAARLGIGLNDGLAAGAIADTPKQPLGFHPALIAAARGHSAWMLETDIFSHTGGGGSSPSQRAQAAGYPSGVAENIAWGGTTGTPDEEAFTRARHDRLFISPGHRQNLCNPSHRELGAGVLFGEFLSNGTNWNAVMVTHKFGSSTATPWPFIVGVAYYDFNGNGAYDPGEGIGGIRVDLEGGAYFTATAAAGGFSLPRPWAAATRVVTYSGEGLAESVTVNLASGANHKVDLALEYTPPVLSGPITPLVGRLAEYGITPVPGATGYEVRVFSATPTFPDGANDLSRVLDGTSAAYAALSTTVRYEGTGAYRMAHPTPVSQILEYRESFRPGPDASLEFRSRLGLATVSQVARVEVSADGGASWTAVYSQAGSGSSGESSFQFRSVSLGAYAGQLIRLRFHYQMAGSSYYPQTTDGAGWYVDAVTFANIATVTPEEERTLSPGESFGFVPTAAGEYFLGLQPLNFSRRWPAGALLSVSAISPPSGYAAWSAHWESVGGLSVGTLGNHPMGDHNQSGTAHLIAYALGLNPLECNGPQLPAWVVIPEGYAFEYTVAVGGGDIVVAPELSTDLVVWHPPGATALGFASADLLVAVEGSHERRRVVFPDGLPSSVQVRLGIRLD